MFTVKRIVPYLYSLICLAILSVASAETELSTAGHYTQQDGVVYFVSTDRADALSIDPDSEIVIFRGEIEGKPVFMENCDISTSTHAKELRLEKGLQGYHSLMLVKWDSLEQIDIYANPTLVPEADNTDTIELLDCPNLTNVRVWCDPNAYTDRLSLYFKHCPNLTDIHIDEGPSDIWIYGGYPYETATTCRISASVEHVYISQHLWIQVSEDNPFYYAMDDVLYHREDNALVHYPDGKTDEIFTVPEGVTHIDIDNPYLQALTLPNGVESLVLDCPSLASINTPPAENSTYADSADGVFPESLQKLKLSSDTIVSIALPQSLEDFSLDCKNLLNIALSPSSETYRLIDGVVYSHDTTRLVYYPQARPSPSYTSAPHDLAEITIHNPYLKNLTIPRLDTHYDLSLECDGLEVLSLPSNFSLSGYYLSPKYLMNLGSLHTMHIMAGGEYSSYEGAIYSADGTVLCFVPKGKEGVFVIPEGTKYVRWDYVEYYDDGYLYESAFSRANKIEKVIFPSSMQEINAKFFEQNSALTALEVAPENPRFRSRDGVIFSKDGKTLIAQLVAGREHMSLPAGIEIVGENALPSNKVLESLVVPHGVHTLDTFSLSGNLALRQVSLPQTLRYVKESAFEDCMDLEHVTFPEGVESIGGAFSISYVIALEHIDRGGYPYSSIEITLPSTLQSVAHNAFVDPQGIHARKRDDVMLVVPDNNGFANDYALLCDIPYRVTGDPRIYNPLALTFVMQQDIGKDNLPYIQTDEVPKEGALLQLLSAQRDGFYAMDYPDRYSNVYFVPDPVPQTTIIAKDVSRLCVLVDATPLHTSLSLRGTWQDIWLAKGTIAHTTKTIGPIYEITTLENTQYSNALYIEANSIQLLSQQKDIREATIVTESLAAKAPLYALPKGDAQILEECFAGTIVSIFCDDGTWACIREDERDAPLRYIRSEHLREATDMTAY